MRKDDRSLRARSMPALDRAARQQIDGVEINGGLAELLTDERDKIVIHPSRAQPLRATRRRRLDIVSDSDPGPGLLLMRQHTLYAELHIAEAGRPYAAWRAL